MQVVLRDVRSEMPVVALGDASDGAATLPRVFQLLVDMVLYFAAFLEFVPAILGTEGGGRPSCFQGALFRRFKNGKLSYPCAA